MLYNPVSYILQSPEMTWYDFTTNSYVVSTYSHYIASALTAVPRFVPALDEELGQHILQLCEVLFTNSAVSCYHHSGDDTNHGKSYKFMSGTIVLGCITLQHPPPGMVLWTE